MRLTVRPSQSWISLSLTLFLFFALPLSLPEEQCQIHNIHSESGDTGGAACPPLPTTPHQNHQLKCDVIINHQLQVFFILVNGIIDIPFF